MLATNNYRCCSTNDYWISEGIGVSTILVYIPVRTPTRIPINTWPIDEAEGIGLRVAAEAWIVVSMPVVMQACAFDVLTAWSASGRGADL